jgi:hypothetical protein
MGVVERYELDSDECHTPTIHDHGSVFQWWPSKGLMT